MSRAIGYGTVMIGALLLLAAASVSGGPTVAARPPAFRPSSRATARGTVTIRIVSGVRFGPEHQRPEAGAAVRSIELIDRDGVSRHAKLMEFQ